MQWSTRTVGCPMCGSDDQQALIPSVKFDAVLGEMRQHPVIKVVVCRCCGLVFENPQVDLAAAADYADKHYYHASNPVDLQDRHQDFINAHRWAMLRDRVDWAACRRSLDVGATGAWSAKLKQEHPQQVSAVVEPSSEAVDYCRLRYPEVEAHCRTFEDFSDQPGSYDFISFWYSFYCFGQPRTALAKARELLSDGGRLLICISHLRMAHEVWQFGAPWVNLAQIVTTTPLVYYSRRTLERMLELEGFRVVDAFVGDHVAGDVEGNDFTGREEYVVLAEPVERLPAAMTADALSDPEEVEASTAFFTRYPEMVTRAALTALEQDAPIRRISLLCPPDPVFQNLARTVLSRPGVEVDTYPLEPGGGLELQHGDEPGHVLLNATRADIGAAALNGQARHLRAYDCLLPDRHEAYDMWVTGEDGEPLLAKALCPGPASGGHLFPYAGLSG